MTENELLEEYPLLKHKDFKLAKASICELIGKDKGTDFTDDRAFMTEYFDSSSEKTGDTYFWEMLRFLRYILEDATAYTTKDGIISLNVPNTEIIPNDKDKVRRWYFVYCHECLHQLWDTFAVGDEIKQSEGECDFQLLNIASDCVINDFLQNVDNKFKLPPVAGVFPEVLKDKYGVEYSRAKDTQYTLYMKLKAVSDKMQEQMKQEYGDGDMQDGDGNGQSSGNGNSGDNQKNTNSGNQQNNGKQSDKNKSDNEGNGNGDKTNSGEGAGKEKSDTGGEGNDTENSQSHNAGTEEGVNDIIEELKGEPQKIVKKYQDALSGNIGKFVEQCKKSKQLKKNGLMAEAQRGSSEWNKQLELVAKKYIKQKLESKKKYRNTYTRVRRGERAFTAADMGRRIVNPGREEIRTKIGFNMSVYIDVSGSMGDNLSKVFDATYAIIADLSTRFGKEKIVDKNQITTDAYVFTTTMKKIKFGSKVNANGGTYEFGQLLSDIHKNGQDAFLNIIITDGDFQEINNEKVAKSLQDMEGLIILVSNKAEGYFDDLIKYTKTKTPNKLVAIYSDSEWTLKK